MLAIKDEKDWLGMGHTVELPDTIYEAIERYARQRGQTPEMVIVAWGRSIQEQVEQSKSDQQRSEQQPVSQATQQPFDPWHGFLTEATSPDATLRHDFYLGEDALDPHESE